MELLGHDGARGDDTEGLVELGAVEDESERGFSASDSSGIVGSRAVDVQGLGLSVGVLSSDVDIYGRIGALLLGRTSVGDLTSSQLVADKRELGAEHDDEHDAKSPDEPKRGDDGQEGELSVRKVLISSSLLLGHVQLVGTADGVQISSLDEGVRPVGQGLEQVQTNAGSALFALLGFLGGRGLTFGSLLTLTSRSHRVDQGVPSSVREGLGIASIVLHIRTSRNDRSLGTEGLLQSLQGEIGNQSSNSASRDDVKLLLGGSGVVLLDNLGVERRLSSHVNVISSGLNTSANDGLTESAVGSFQINVQSNAEEAKSDDHFNPAIL